MDTKKTLRDNWEFGRETVAIRVSSYRNNGNLYVGLCHKAVSYTHLADSLEAAIDYAMNRTKT